MCSDKPSHKYLSSPLWCLNLQLYYLNAYICTVVLIFTWLFLLAGIVLKKAFPAMTRSSVRKDLNLLLKKARALNKENCLKVKNKNGKWGQEHRSYKIISYKHFIHKFLELLFQWRLWCVFWTIQIRPVLELKVLAEKRLVFCGFWYIWW